MPAIKAPVILNKLTPRVDKSWKVEVETRELSGKDIQVLGDLLGSEGWFIFSANLEDLDNTPVPEEKAEAGIGERKSLSQRLYATLFAYWKYAGEPDEDFEVWRKKQMEKLMDIYKAKMPEKR